MVPDNYAPYGLDEPTKFVSKGELAVNAAQFIRNMVSFTGKQTIVSTHDSELQKDCQCRYKMVLDKETGISKAHKEI